MKKISGNREVKRVTLYRELASHGYTVLAVAHPGQAAMKDHLENYLTLNPGFKSFAEKAGNKSKLELLSNDVSEWSEYLADFHGINKYFYDKIVSGGVGLKNLIPRSAAFHIIYVLEKK